MRNIPFIPYFQTSRYRVQTMIELANIQPGEKAADLGSGDGRILLALAQAGARLPAPDLPETLHNSNPDNGGQARLPAPEHSNGGQVEVHGYELDERLIKDSRNKIQEAGLILETKAQMNASISLSKNKPTIFLHQTDFWQEDLSRYNIITIYPMPDIMEALEEKLQNELHPGARVLLNFYPFPHWKLVKSKDHIYLYKR